MRLTSRTTNITSDTTWNEDILLDHGQYVINITPGIILYMSGTSKFSSMTPCSLVINYGTVQIDGDKLTNSPLITVSMNNCYLHISNSAVISNTHMINTNIIGYMTLEDSIMDHCIVDDDISVNGSYCNGCNIVGDMNHVHNSNINRCSISKLTGSIAMSNINTCRIGNCNVLEITDGSNMSHITGDVNAEFLRDSMITYIDGNVNVSHESRLSEISHVVGNISVKVCKTNRYSYNSGNITLDICENSDIIRIDGNITVDYLVHCDLRSNQQVSISIGTVIESTIEYNSGCLTDIKNITRSNYRCNNIGDDATTTLHVANSCRIVDNDSYQECIGSLIILSGGNNIIRDNNNITLSGC